MLGKPSGQMGFGDLEATGRVPEGHFLKKVDGRIDRRPFQKVLGPLYHPTRGRPSHPPVMMFKALLLQQWYGLSDPGLEEAICDRSLCPLSIAAICSAHGKLRKSLLRLMGLRPTSSGSFARPAWGRGRV